MTVPADHISGPVLETERLTLRPPALSDWKGYAEFFALEASDMVGGPLGERDAWKFFSSMAGHWVLRGYGWFTVERRDTRAVVGTLGPHFPPYHDDLEIGWITYPAAQGRGFGYEAARAARDWTVDTLRPERLVSYIDPGNTASRALADKLGASPSGKRASHDPGCDVWLHPMERPS